MLTLATTILLSLVNLNDLPAVTVKADDTPIDKSCRIVIPPGTIIEDKNDNGVLQIKADGITVEFAEDTVLRGAGKETPPNEYKGIGIRLNGHKDVTLKNARVQGYLGGIYATKSDGLTLDGCIVSDIRRMHLKSTPVAEDGADWLWPHNNDNNEWLKNYGAAIYIEDSDKITVRRCRVRDSQNGLCLDRVNGSKVYDNDCSFLSGWGLAMWRSCKNVVSRNAFDFCVRGYSHGVYNRGQDSAGILFFEQNCDNVIAENSATHGGDGLFGFAGREALGEAAGPSNFDYKRKGCNDNLLFANDFSYAPAHGIEMTFSFGNKFISNRLVGNAICGIWGGYCQDTLISCNEMADNGEMGYGLERGGVNIDSGRNNRIVDNKFRKNKCGVHFWDNRGGDLSKKPWGLANKPMSVDNLIAANTFEGDQLAFHFRGPCETRLGSNTLKEVKKEMESEPAAKVTRTQDEGEAFKIKPEILGETRPVGARKHLYGRENIIMTEWGPWDHESPLIRQVSSKGREIAYELHKFGDNVDMQLKGEGLKSRSGKVTASGAIPYTIVAEKDGVYPYTLMVRNADDRTTRNVAGTLVATQWNATFFAWTDETDPRKNLEAYRKLAEGPDACTAKLDQLVCKYGHGGPKNLRTAEGKALSDSLEKSTLTGDRFGMIAKTKLELPAGKWKLATMSDDGVRVTVNGKPVIDNWTWHVPTRNEGVFEQAKAGAVEIVVEHFEIDGFATLEFEIAPAA